MKFSKRCYTTLLSLGFLFIAGCNIFNPSGTNSVDEKDADALIAYGQKLFQQSAYTDAMVYFSKAIAVDSTKSEAYFGMAKAGLRSAGVNPLTLLKLVGKTSDSGGAIPFVNEAITTQNTYFQGMRAVDSSLKPLINRDTLTELWEYATKVDSDPAYLRTLPDSIQTRVSQFRSEYKHGSSYLYGSKSESFPLSDRKFKYDRFRIDYTLAQFTVLILGFMDFDGNHIIDSNDFPIKFSKDANGNLVIDVGSIVDAAASDPATAKNLNANIEKLANGSGDLSALLQNVGSSLGAGELSSATKSQLDSQVADLGDAVRFYKLGDSIDNDGDGCVDEELFDSTDNDYDGFIDEDIRVVLKTSAPGEDFLDNDANGIIDEANENIFVNILPSGDTTATLGFTSEFPKNPDGTPFNSTDKLLKLAVARDHTGSVYSLAQRQTLIGGCWHNYNAATFAAYLARQNK